MIRVLTIEREYGSGGAEIAKSFPDGREGAAPHSALLGMESDFDIDLFGFVGEHLALRGFAVEFRLSIREFFLDLQQVGDAHAGLGKHPAQTVAKISLVFEFGLDVNDRSGLVLRFRGVLCDFSSFPNEVEEFVQVGRRDASGYVP